MLLFCYINLVKFKKLTLQDSLWLIIWNGGSIGVVLVPTGHRRTCYGVVKSVKSCLHQFEILVFKTQKSLEQNWTYRRRVCTFWFMNLSADWANKIEKKWSISFRLFHIVYESCVPYAPLIRILSWVLLTSPFAMASAARYASNTGISERRWLGAPASIDQLEGRPDCARCRRLGYTAHAIRLAGAIL